MAIVVGASADAVRAGNANANIVINVPTHSDGDLLVTFLGIDNVGNSGAASSSGWTSRYSSSDSSAYPSLNILTRQAGASEPTDYTFAWSTGQQASGVMVAIAGIDDTDLSDATTTTNSGSSSTLTNASPTITTNTDGAIVFYTISNDGNAWTDGNFPTGPTGLYSKESNNFNESVGLGVAYELIATAGASGAQTWPTMSASQEWTTATLAFKPTADDLTIDVPLGALSLTGQVPTVDEGGNLEVAVPLGALSLTGQIPTVVAPETIDIPVGALALTGQVPTIIAGETIDVPVGALTLTGQIPTVVAPETIDIPVGSLALTGQVPTVVTPNAITIPVGSLALTGQVPTIQTTTIIDIPVGSLALSGFAPTANTTDNQTIDIPVGSLALTGQAPVVALGPLSINIPVGALLLSGFAPEIADSRIWTTQVDTAASWSAQSDDASNWAAQTDTPTTWTIQ